MPVCWCVTARPHAAHFSSLRATAASISLLDALGRVVGVVVVEVGLDVLRMVDVAVVALAVVLPDELPVGLDVVVDRLGDLGAAEALRPQRRRQQPPAPPRSRAGSSARLK